MMPAQNLPLGEPLVLYTERGPLCGLVLAMDSEVLEVGVILSQGWLPPEKQLPLLGVVTEVNREALWGWAPLQTDLCASREWDFAWQQQCGFCPGKTFRNPRD